MKGLVYTGIQMSEIQDLDLPIAGAAQVLVVAQQQHLEALLHLHVLHAMHMPYT